MEPLLCALGALLIRAGFAIHGAGMSRSKNSAGAVVRHLCDFCVAVLAFWAIGYAIISSGSRFFGVRGGALFGINESETPMMIVQTVAVLIATGIVPGVLAERARFWPSLASAILLAAVVVPVVVLWTLKWVDQEGWLARTGYTDAGGAGWLHLPGALCAAVGAVFVGARTGKFNRDGSSTAIPGHSLPLVGVGVFVQLLGFFFFVTATAGSHAYTAAMNVLLAGAAGGVASTLLGKFRYYKPDIHLTYAGVIGALVAISAGAGVVPGLGAVLIGAVAGVVVPMAILSLDVMLRIDDPSGGIAIHGGGAIWGLIATPLVARGLTTGQRFKTLGAQLLGTAAIALLTVVLSVVLWTLLKRLGKVRASEADEFDGLDLAEHDVGAYPDFQQNTIKSYHLREV